MVSAGRAARRLAAVAMAGGALQLVYGVLAVVWPYPQIIVPALELVWGLVNLGMVAGIVAWLAIDVARPRWLALIGGGLAIGTAVGRRLPGLGRWAPGLVLATGLMTAAFYSLDKVTHFVLLGLLWGAAWMLLAYVAHRQATEPDHLARQVAAPWSQSEAIRRP